MSFPKVKGLPLRQERKQRRQQATRQTDYVRRAVQRRDRVCRVPGCKARGELAHLEAKGMGGDHGLRTTTANCALVCHDHHRGQRSIHSGDLVVEKLTAAGADGPLGFYWPDTGDRTEEL
jgi:hypothetical protein